MHAEWSVDIGPDSPALEVPWRSEDGSLRFFDLKKQPELLLEVTETHEHFEMADFLAGVNNKTEMATAKCDIWLTDEMDVEDEFFGEPLKRCSYVDCFFERELERYEFAAHEKLADLIVTKFGRLPEMPASLEIVIRQCHFHLDEKPDESKAGYSFTFYITGYGGDETNAHVHWAIALKLLRYAIHQLVHTPGKGDSHPDA
jgi:hypothetical protein